MGGTGRILQGKLYIMMGMEPKEYLRILHQAGKLKQVMRHCWTADDRRESVADHSWRTALMAMLLKGEEEFRDLFGFSPRLNWERIKTQQLRETLAADIRERTWDDMQGQVLARCWFYENDEETGTCVESRELVLVRLPELE